MSCSVMVKKEPIDDEYENLNITYAVDVLSYSSNRKIKLEETESMDSISSSSKVTNKRTKNGNKHNQTKKINRENKATLKPKTEIKTESNDPLPLLTPPSSPESNPRNVAEQALLGHQGLVDNTRPNSVPTRSSHGTRILLVNQKLPTAAVTQRYSSLHLSMTSTGEIDQIGFGK